ncbi:anaerobic ribonucleoside-triphosphate reductase activating protein [bacterium]|nr:anaerobic ribonucleoside-triphosphate reductase activating protein [bacterium]
MSYGIKGFTPTSLTDWPGKISAVIFLPRCNFRCHYCYNPEFINDPDGLPDIEDDEIFSYLEKKRKWIDGVVMLGGEPTIHPKFMDIVKKVKAMNLGIAVHTNGTTPDIVKQLIDENLVDYFAMDIKAPFSKYKKVVNVDIDVKKVEESAKIIMDSNVDYEFRTTVVPDLITKEDIKEMGESLKGAKRFFIQQFKPGNTLDPEYQRKKVYLIPELNELKKEAEKYFKEVQIRGPQ